MNKNLTNFIEYNITNTKQNNLLVIDRTKRIFLYMNKKKGKFMDNPQQSLICIPNSKDLLLHYCRATAIAPINATKRIIEMSSNGRKKSVDKWIPICCLLLIKSCSTIWFDFVVQIIPYHDVSGIVVISETKILVQTIDVTPSPTVQRWKIFVIFGTIHEHHSKNDYNIYSPYVNK
uniref:NADH-plastoquinone oxidoreductase subunit I n=1 Tax=Torilis scabra TaxID=79188 RepID=A0A650DRE7_9APIA|nr:NADH-plastoquinone oxidoreductase subunit I [Torilis scabra]